MRDRITEVGTPASNGWDSLREHFDRKPVAASMRPMPSTPLRAVAGRPHIWRALPDWVPLFAQFGRYCQAARCSINGVGCTMVAISVDGLRSAKKCRPYLSLERS